ncbi:alpha/beta hydrolase [Candidatus Leptofilum sp.]|uniref:alpha/beta hydrolase n=1 Tax=Candidatus Leptofilum sp. TaxID=3241576 RepID=UPI003B5A7F98
MKKLPTLTLIGIALTAVALFFLYSGDRVLADGEKFAVSDPNGRPLSATFYPGTQPAGILLLAGFGSDQMAMRTAASEFAQAGVAVMTMDFSGHGRSPGTITFDNAATADLAWQTLAGIEAFTAKSGLAPNQIIIMGHSMGARVGLQAMTLTDDPVAGLILLGAQVNLESNQQAETFTGVSDSELLWVKGLSTNLPASDVLLMSGQWDDILPPSSAKLLLGKLQEGEASSWRRELSVLDRLVHNYEIYSPRVMTQAKTWAGQRWGIPLAAEAATAQMRLILWAVGLVGIFLAVAAGWRWAAQTWPGTPLTFHLQIEQTNRFLIGKTALWLAAVPFALLLGGLFFVLPLGLPAFNLYYVCFIGGYGLLLLLLYWRGRVPGVNGRLPFVRSQATAVSPKRLVLAIGISLGILGIVTAFIQTGLFFYPTGQRFIWLLIYTPFTALGFAIGLREIQLVHQSGAGWGALLITAVIGLIPFILYTLFLAALGSISGMLGGLQGLIILALVWLSGGLIYQVAQRLWLTAVFQAFLLYWLVLPVGPLFSV